MFGSRRIAIVAVLIVVLVGFVIFGLGTGEYSASGGSYGTELVPVDPASKANGVTGDPDIRAMPERDRAPESTLGFRGQRVSSAGQILGIWEPQRWMASKHGGPAENRADGYLTLSSGDLLEVPRGVELTFRYGGELEMSHVFDSLAFEVNERELSYGKDIGSLEVSSDLEDPYLPVVLPVTQPETVGQQKVLVTANLPPGVYVISVSASVPEGDVRYNFRVLIS
ncbi:MAG: hypothetical protein WA982_10895 [Rubrobacteraceae bacterium]